MRKMLPNHVKDLCNVTYLSPFSRDSKGVTKKLKFSLWFAITYIPQFLMVIIYIAKLLVLCPKLLMCRITDYGHPMKA